MGLEASGGDLALQLGPAGVEGVDLGLHGGQCAEARGKLLMVGEIDAHGGRARPRVETGQLVLQPAGHVDARVSAEAWSRSDPSLSGCTIRPARRVGRPPGRVAGAYCFASFLISVFMATSLTAGFGLQKSGSAATICGEGRLIFGLKA